MEEEIGPMEPGGSSAKTEEENSNTESCGSSEAEEEIKPTESFYVSPSSPLASARFEQIISPQIWKEISSEGKHCSSRWLPIGCFRAAPSKPPNGKPSSHPEVEDLDTEIFSGSLLRDAFQEFQESIRLGHLLPDNVKKCREPLRAIVDEVAAFPWNNRDWLEAAPSCDREASSHPTTD